MKRLAVLVPLLVLAFEASAQVVPDRYILELSGDIAEPEGLSVRFANALCTTVN